MKCSHDYDYPLDGKDPEVGPWICNPDGSNPNCPDCEPDAWARVLYSWVDDSCDDNPTSAR